MVEYFSFFDYLLNKGYYFDKELIENYLLSLKVKPFVILTGNSGTGKTKLSQLFSQFITLDVDNDVDEDDDYFHVSVPINLSSWKNHAWTLNSNSFKSIFPIEECQVNCDMLIDNIPAEGRISLGIQLEYYNQELIDYLKQLHDSGDEDQVNLKIDNNSLRKFISDDYIEPNGSIILKQNATKSAADERQWFMNKNIFNYLPFESGQFPCYVEIDNFKSDAKIRIFPRLSFKRNIELQNYLNDNKGNTVTVELKINNDDFNFKDFKSELFENSDKLITDVNLESKYKIVPVGANWTDNTNIVGYYNAITNEYQSTPAFNLINKAIGDNSNPYFLILDEMNLSHVERYFSDFLSSIESKEPIPLFGGDDLSVSLPDNLFIIGTVNIDETTYMFSPKVLDRANTIEFEPMSVVDYISDNISFDDFCGNIEYLQSPLVDNDVFNYNISNLKDILSNITSDGENLLYILTDELNKFQQSLKGSGFDFGFRVINEILRFMVVSWRYENEPDEWDNWERYFDAQIKQKILPKLHGSEKAIGSILNKLFNLCLRNTNNNEQAILFNVTKEDCKYYTSSCKLQEMAKILSNQRYVSFIN